MNLTTEQTRTVKQLLDRFNQTEDGSRMVVLHGEPGVGKTTVVHSFYRELHSRAARANSEPLIWSRTLASQQTPRALARKCVEPEIVEPLGPIPFAWWGVRCRADTLNNPTAPDASSLLTDLLRHLADYDSTVRQSQEREDIARVLVALIGASGGFLLGAFGAVAAGFTSWYALGDEVVGLVRRLVASDEQRRTYTKNAGRLPWSTRSDWSLDAVERLTWLAKWGVPAVFVIEDAHWADTSVVRLCDAILASKATQVLVLATAASEALLEQMADRRGLGSMLVEAELDYTMVTPERRSWRYRPVPLAIDVATDAEARRAADDLISDNPTVAREIALRSGGNFERLHLLVERHVAGWDIDDSTTLPLNTDPVALRWAMLQPGIQRLLAAASIQGPVFYEQPLHGVFDPTDVYANNRAYTSLRDRAVALGQLMWLDEWRLAFSDLSLQSHALDRLPDIISPTIVTRLRRYLFDTISEDKHDEGFWDNLPLSVQSTMLSNHTSLYSDLSPDLEDALGEDLMDSYDRLAGISAGVDAYAEAMRASARAVRLVDDLQAGDSTVDVSTVLHVRARHAYLPAAARRDSDLIEAGWKFADGLAEVYGPGSSQALMARHSIASLLAERHAYSEAVAEATSVLGAGVGVLSEGVLLAVERDKAKWTGKAGNPTDARRQLEALLPRLIAHYGRDDSEVLAVRSDIAYWLGRAGLIDEAVAASERLLPDHERVYGPDHAETLTVRHNLAHWVGEAGRQAESTTP